MALAMNDLRNLMITVAKADKQSPTAFSFGEQQYSYTELNEALRAELNELAGSFRKYQRNQDDIFELLEETIDEVLPERIRNTYEMFAETRTFSQGQSVVFHQKTGKHRARQFVSRVGLAGIYEVFKLDKQMFEVNTTAYGGAAQIGFEEFLDGRVNFAELLEIVMQGLEDAVYEEVTKALMGGVKQLPAANVKVVNEFDADELDRLLSVIRVYGDPTIYCTYAFATQLLPADKWISDAQKSEYNAKGYIGSWKGARIVILPQYFLDTENAEWGITDSVAFVIPGGSVNDKPVKIAFEGQTIVDEYKNHDRSREIQIYKKLGVAVLMTNNIGVYQNLAITTGPQVTLK